MQYVLTEQELEEIRSNPQKGLAQAIEAHKKEIQADLRVYNRDVVKVIEEFCPPERLDECKRKLEPAIMGLAKVFGFLYR